MQTLADELLKIVEEYNIAPEGVDPDTPYNDEQAKKLKKKLKKNIVDLKEDTLITALDKFNKMVEGLNKSYESAFKAKSQYTISKEGKDSLAAELNKEVEHKKRIEGLHASFMKKYNEELKAAQNYEVEQTENKKKYTEELQARIKTIQDKFEESGKRKIQSIRQNEIAKEELNRLSTHLQASEALVDAQLKKKGLEVDIQMSTLKQKVEMIETLKTHGEGSSEKLLKAKTDEEKIQKKLKVFQQKQEEHKLAITKAHVLIEEYKTSIYKIRQLLDKLSSESEKLMIKCRKSEDALKQSRSEQSKLKTERDTHNAQLQGLQNLEATLKEQLKNL